MTLHTLHNDDDLILIMSSSNILTQSFAVLLKKSVWFINTKISTLVKYKQNWKSCTGLEQHMGEYKMTELSFLDELAL